MEGTHDRQRLIMSDGSSTLYFWDPETFEQLGQVHVHDDQGPVIRINELEYVNGEVYANIWLTNLIAKINPATGQVIAAYVDLTGLLGSGGPAASSVNPLVALENPCFTG